MKLPVLKSASLIGVMLLATTACAQPNTADMTNKTVSQKVNHSAQAGQNTKAIGTVSKSVDSRLRQLLTQAGIKTQITSIVPSKLPNMYQVNLAEQLPLHITEECHYLYNISQFFLMYIPPLDLI